MRLLKNNKCLSPRNASGGPGAAERRKELLHRLELPERLSPNALLEVLNALFTLGELEDTVRGADAKKFS